MLETEPSLTGAGCLGFKVELFANHVWMIICVAESNKRFVDLSLPNTHSLKHEDTRATFETPGSGIGQTFSINDVSRT